MLAQVLFWDEITRTDLKTLESNFFVVTPIRESGGKMNARNFICVSRLKGFSGIVACLMLIIFALPIQAGNREEYDHIANFNFVVEIQGMPVGRFVDELYSKTGGAEYKDEEEFLQIKRPDNCTYINHVLKNESKDATLTELRFFGTSFREVLSVDDSEEQTEVPVIMLNVDMEKSDLDWLRTTQSGTCVDETGGLQTWTMSDTIILVPDHAVLMDDYVWYDADNTEIGPLIWGRYALLESVETGHCADNMEPLRYVPDPDNPGNWIPAFCLTD